MWFFLLKVIISGIVVALVSSLGKKFPMIGGILAALPIISILSIGFLYYETNGNTEQIGKLSFNIGWFVLSSGAFLLLLPMLLKRQFSFAVALIICLAVLLVIDGILIIALKNYDY